jgi:hypothetical protein
MIIFRIIDRKAVLSHLLSLIISPGTAGQIYFQLLNIHLLSIISISMLSNFVPTLSCLYKRPVKAFQATHVVNLHKSCLYRI